MKTFKIGGIHPSACKLTADKGITRVPEPSVLTLLLGQSIGRPAKPVVKAGDIVVAGQKIAEADGPVSCNLHSPRAGKISKIAKVRTREGYWQEAVILECEPEQPLPEFPETDSEEVAAMDAGQIIEAVREAGIVGMGGAAFPTAVKLIPPAGMKIDTVIINGAECEPYLTCDDRLMREYSRGIVLGAQLLMKAVGVKKGVIGIEANKPEAIAAMERAVEHYPGIEVAVLRTKYPQGGEKQLIAAITGRQVPSGQLPASVGVIVDNVATAYAVYEAVYCRKPLIERVITVTGEQMSAAGNFLAPVGISIESLLAFAGGVEMPSSGLLKVIGGGPMMGRAMSETEAPVTKATSGILVMEGEKVLRQPEQPCIRCGRCVDGCPMGLEPYLLIAQARHGLWQEMKDSNAMDCIECGSCSWVCPANKPLLDYVKIGKIEIRKKKL